MTNLKELVPDIKVSVNQMFGIDTEMKVDGFSKKNEYVPEIDSNYKFDRDTTLAIISGFTFNWIVIGSGLGCGVLLALCAIAVACKTCKKRYHDT